MGNKKWEKINSWDKKVPNLNVIDIYPDLKNAQREL